MHQINDTTRTYPRTMRAVFGMSPEDAQAIFATAARHERMAIWFGSAWLGAGMLAVFLLSGCADDVHAYAAAQADLCRCTADAWAKEAGK